MPCFGTNRLTALILLLIITFDSLLKGDTISLVLSCSSIGTPSALIYMMRCLSGDNETQEYE